MFDCSDGAIGAPKERQRSDNEGIISEKFGTRKLRKGWQHELRSQKRCFKNNPPDSNAFFDVVHSDTFECRSHVARRKRDERGRIGPAA